jgi:hypothetical protein
MRWLYKKKIVKLNIQIYPILLYKCIYSNLYFIYSDLINDP